MKSFRGLFNVKKLNSINIISSVQIFSSQIANEEKNVIPTDPQLTPWSCIIFMQDHTLMDNPKKGFELKISKSLQSNSFYNVIHENATTILGWELHQLKT